MKILHIIYTNGISGAEKHLKYLLPGLVSKGIECELLILCPPFCFTLLSNFSDEMNRVGVKSTVISIRNNVSIKTLTVVKNFLINKKFSIVHSHLLRTDLIVSLIKQFYLKNLYIISTKHGYQENVLISYNPSHPKIKKDIIYYITKYTFGKINKNISISKAISELFINLKLTKHYFPVIYHGVDISIGLLENTRLNKGNSIKLLIVGRLEKYKGHIYAIKAFKIISEKYSNAKLVFLGEGSEKDALKKDAAKLGLTDKILFLGFQNNPFDYIINSNIIIIPSIFEPFGLVFIEAMALKTPIVAFDTPAGNELLVNNKTAMLSPKFDVDSLAHNIIELLEDKIKSKLISDNALISYQNNFTTEIMIKNIITFYQKIELEQIKLANL